MHKPTPLTGLEHAKKTKEKIVFCEKPNKPYRDVVCDSGDPGTQKRIAVVAEKKRCYVRLP